jgi:hypothetical protein
MSNVLIGIIGVILFIGLALAGALFLGPRFQDATSNSKASAYVEAMKQVTQAAQLYRTNEGEAPAPGSPTGLVSKGYLKSIPANPVWPVADLNLISADGSSAKTPALVIAGMPETPEFVRFCIAINRQLGIPMTKDVSPDAESPLSQPIGCYHPTAQWGQYGVGQYLVYSRL